MLILYWCVYIADDNSRTRRPDVRKRVETAVGRRTDVDSVGYKPTFYS